MRPAAAALALLAAAACGSPREADPADAEAPASAAAPAPAPARTAPPAAGRAPADTLAELRLVKREPLRGRSLDELGLSGGNKPNGPGERLRRGVPLETPAHVPRELDGLELFVADSTPEGWLAFYRGPLEMRPGSANAAFRAALFAADGGRAWEVDLGAHLSRPDHLEVQDLRYADGALYFNEACQSYSREAGGAARRWCGWTRGRGGWPGGRARGCPTTSSCCTGPGSRRGTASPPSPTRSSWWTAARDASRRARRWTAPVLPGGRRPPAHRPHQRRSVHLPRCPAAGYAEVGDPAAAAGLLRWTAAHAAHGGPPPDPLPGSPEP